MTQLRPNQKEIEVPNLFYNRFYDLYDEIIHDNFLLSDEKFRFYKIH